MNARYLFLLLLGVLMSHLSTAQSPLDAATIDRFITQQMKAQSVPGLALAITRGNDILYLKGYGEGGGQAITPQTQFFIASLSKSFTAVAVMQLVEDGKVDIDASVQTYLPEFTLTDAEAAKQITIRQLLNQTSGLADAGFPELRLPQPSSVEERVTSLRTAKLVSPPGSKFHYFNPNYGVLARVVEVVSEQDFSAYLQEHIFAPLEMNHTFNIIISDDVPQKATTLAQGYLLAFGIPIASPEESGYLGGSGGIISTAEDMAHYLVMQNNNGRFQGKTLISPESIALTHTPPQTLESDYGMGWFAMTEDGQRVLEHNGILSTFYSEAVLLPESGYSFVLLYNVHSVNQEALGFPQFKKGLIALLSNEAPPMNSFNARTLGIVFALITLLTLILNIRGLLNVQHLLSSIPLWRHLLAIAWGLVPLVLLLFMPALVLSTSGRAFGYITLFRSMLDISLWFGVWAVLGAANAVARMVLLFRS